MWVWWGRVPKQACASHTATVIVLHFEYRLVGDSGVAAAMHWVRANGWHLEAEPVHKSRGGGKILGETGDVNRSLCFLDSDVDG